ncbi:MAG: dienelactone hydrolase, partial [Xenococcus sp. (in: cyanobacteria)]
DTVLLTGELDRQNLARENFQTIPEKPLTCDFYGLILPKGDRQWRKTVNAFLRNEQQRTIMNKWLGDYLPQALSDTSYCLNQQRSN